MKTFWRTKNENSAQHSNMLTKTSRTIWYIQEYITSNAFRLQMLVIVLSQKWWRVDTSIIVLLYYLLVLEEVLERLHYKHAHLIMLIK